MPAPVIGMAAQGAVNAITGIVNQEMQAQQQNRNYAQAHKYNKKMTDYNMQKQLEMWEKTGYGPQMEQMKAAGLNPALMYGSAGAGGSTNVATSSQGPAQANMEPIKGMDVASMMQLELLKAQKENIEANTNKTNVEATKTSGVDTEAAKIQLELSKIDLKVNEQTVWEQINEIVANSIKAQEESVTAGVQKEVSQETRDAEIQIVKQHAMNLAVQKALMDAQITLTEEQVKKISADIMQRAQEIVIQEGYLNLQRLNQEFNNNWGTIIGKGGVEAVKGLIQVLPFMRFAPKVQPRTEIKGFQPPSKRY